MARARSTSSPAGSPTALAVTHFGAWEDVAAHLAAMREALDHWAHLALRTSEEEYAAENERAMREGGAEGPLFEAYRRAMPPPMLWAGWARYWAGKEKAAEA